jgi:hypothetical protein
MAITGTEALGWAATAVFVSSYFFAKPAALRAAQMLGAILWIVYGVLISAVPVVAANALVFAAAAWTFARTRVGSASTPTPAASDL